MYKRNFLNAIYTFWCNEMQTDKSPWEDEANKIKKQINDYFGGDEESYRFVENLVNSFACSTEKEAFLSGLQFVSKLKGSITKEPESDYWHKEIWTDQDLINALEYRCIEPTKENVSKLRESCKGMFDDSSNRNEMIDDKVCSLFDIDL